MGSKRRVKNKNAKTPKTEARNNVVNFEDKVPTSPLSRDYQAALREFWEGRPRTSIERLTRVLADGAREEETFCFYRLWIEILADQEDQAGLLSLSHHFDVLTVEDEEFANTYFALRGIASLELDDYEAAALAHRSLTEVARNPYVMEFRELFQGRTAPAAEKSELLTVKGRLKDYFHLQTLARSLVIADDHANLTAVGKRIAALYPEAPIMRVITMQTSLARRDYSAALEAARDLAARFPGNQDYTFQLGYVAYHAGDHETAVRELTRLNFHTNEGDADVLGVLGAAHAKMAIATRNETHFAKAEQWLGRSADLLSAQGLPTDFARRILREMKTAFGRGAKATEGRQRVWMVKLSAASFHELKTAPEARLKNIRRAMGEEARPGDFCFFVGELGMSTARGPRGQWRLGALYQVTSEPEWHPLKSYQSELALVARPEFSVPLDIFETDRASHGDRPQVKAYELDQAALRAIDEALEFYAEDATAWTDVIHQLRMSM